MLDFGALKIDGEITPSNLSTKWNNLLDGLSQLYGDFRVFSQDGSKFHSERPDSNFDIIQSDSSEIRALTVHGGKKGKSVFEVWGNKNGQYIHGLTVANQTGNVGIGTTSPGQSLEILKSQEEIIKDIDKGEPNAKQSDLGIRFHVPGNAWYSIGIDTRSKPVLEDRYDFCMGWGAHPGERPELVIKENGNVGIHTRQPQARLEINGDMIIGKAAINKRFIIHAGEPNANGDYLILAPDERNETDEKNEKKYIWRWDRGITLARKGFVGIGTVTPQTKLEVRGDVSFHKPDGGQFNSIRGDSDWDFVQSHSSEKRTVSIHGGQNGKQLFEVFGWNKNDLVHGLTVTNKEGRVGIGTRTPSKKLEVVGNVQCNALSCDILESNSGHKGGILRSRNNEHEISFRWTDHLFEIWVGDMKVRSLKPDW
jgi:hypothetical protein